MSFFAQAGARPQGVKDVSPIPPELSLFARIEGLAVEEAAILAVAVHVCCRSGRVPLPARTRPA
jgi:hypothetical protein